MTSIFDYGGPQFGLADTKMAVNNSDGTFGTAVDVPSVQVLGVEAVVESQTLTGDDRQTASASRITGANVTLRFGSVHMDVLATMLGITLDEAYGAYTSRRVMIANKKTPYVGICGKANAEEGAGDTHLFIPRCKVASNFRLQFEYNTFSIPEITFAAQGDENFLDADGNATVIIPVQYETARDVVLPPV